MPILEPHAFAYVVMMRDGNNEKSEGKPIAAFFEKREARQFAEGQADASGSCNYSVRRVTAGQLADITVSFFS